VKRSYGELKRNHPDAKIIVTGLSLGAALSTVAAADLVSNDILDFTWYSFGSPRIGNIEFS